MRKMIFVFILVASILTACTLLDQQTPLSATKAFFNYLDHGNADRALDLICESYIVPKITTEFLKNEFYEEISNDGSNARVHVTGEIRVTTNVGSGKKMLDFTIELGKVREKWCIKRDSFVSLYQSLTDLSY